VEQVRQEDQTELRELLQAAETQPESHTLLIRHVEKLIPGSAAAVLNRDAHEDRLELTLGAADSRLASVNTERMRASSCLAVRLSHGYDHGPVDRRLKRCEICGKVDGVTTCEPLMFGGQAIGAVLVATSRAIDADDRARLRESVAQAAPILANQHNLATAETRASSDALTGLPNRRAADEVLERMAAQAARHVSPLTAIMLDLDHFKEINDQHGHESGDRALAGVGQIIASIIRSSDFAARVGGEEFLILLPDTDREAAVVVAEKIRTEVEHAKLLGTGTLSASLGLAVLPFDAGETRELLSKADRALYAAKEAGRNRVHVFSNDDAETPLVVSRS
jgi:diguanylate cyclase (GGDEF)-like protein